MLFLYVCFEFVAEHRAHTHVLLLVVAFYPSTAAAWQSSIDFIGLAVIFAWLRLIEYMALLPAVGKIPRAMMNALKTVGFFLLTLVIVFAGFVFGFSTIYSASSTQFRCACKNAG